MNWCTGLEQCIVQRPHAYFIAYVYETNVPFLQMSILTIETVCSAIFLVLFSEMKNV